MALFFISCGIQILSFFFALFGLNHETLIKNKKFLPVIKWTVGILFTGSFVLAAMEAYNSNSRAERQYGIIYADSLQLSSFRVENRMLHESETNKITTQIAKHDSTNTEILTRYGYRKDTINNTLQRIVDKVQGETPPTLTIFEKPKFTTHNNDNVISYDLASLNADVHLVSYYYVFMNVKHLKGATSIINHSAIIDSPQVSCGNMNFTTIIPKGDGVEMIIFYDRNKTFINLEDTFILAMEFTYKSKGNKVQTPLRKVYIMHKNNGGVDEADSYLFGEIALYLKKHKIWKKFYDL